MTSLFNSVKKIIPFNSGNEDEEKEINKIVQEETEDEEKKTEDEKKVEEETEEEKKKRGKLTNFIVVKVIELKPEASMEKLLAKLNSYSIPKLENLENQIKNQPFIYRATPGEVLIGNNRRYMIIEEIDIKVQSLKK